MNKGFSLVELIVVIAIMAILVGVAVPVYTGYITKANEAVDKQYLGELEQAINTVYIDFEANGGNIPAKIAFDAETGMSIPEDGCVGELTAADYADFLEAVEAIVPNQPLKALGDATFTKGTLTFSCDLLAD